MSVMTLRCGLLGTLCVALLGLGTTSAAAAVDPLFVFTPITAERGYFDGPCGLAVDSGGRFYVSDYYKRGIGIFSSAQVLQDGVSTGEPAPIGPCGLALDSSNRLYVNNYHRNVLRYGTSPSFGTGTVIAGVGVDSTHPTGVAADPASGRVYVDARTYVAVYASTGAVVEVGGAPLRIGLDGLGDSSLGDGYGLAVSGFPATAGRIYVPDADSDTVKVYDPAVDAVDPVATIGGPPGGFASLADSAVAVDRLSGEIYVADAVGSLWSEHPETTIDVFDSTGAYEGHLKYNVVNGTPVGLAVDNSAGATKGRVYVTSGNTENASVYAYGPGAATNASPSEPAVFTLELGTSGDGRGSVESQASGIACSSACGSEAAAGRELTLVAAPDPGSTFVGWSGGDCSGTGACAVEMSAAKSVDARFERTSLSRASSPVATVSEIAQHGNLRLSVNGSLSPKRLPRKGQAPIAVSVGLRIITDDGAPPPDLKSLRIEINRAGHFDLAGLPTCPYAMIQPASTSRALANCRSALVGRGNFQALVALKGQESYVARGQMVVFNGTEKGKPVLLAQIYSAYPFSNSFVIPFRLSAIGKGRYGSALTATLPPSLRAWGSLTEIQMRLARRFSYQGEHHSFLSAGCPAPKGFSQAVFPLARTSFSFAGTATQSLTLNRSCRARG